MVSPYLIKNKDTQEKEKERGKCKRTAFIPIERVRRTEQHVVPNCQEVTADWGDNNTTLCSACRGLDDFVSEVAFVHISNLRSDRNVSVGRHISGTLIAEVLYRGEQEGI